MNIPDFLLAAAIVVLASVAVGLVRILHNAQDAERMMATQLFGSGGVATLLLLGVATHAKAVFDVALILALLAAFASVAFVMNVFSSDSNPPQDRVSTTPP